MRLNDGAALVVWGGCGSELPFFFFFGLFCYAPSYRSGNCRLLSAMRSALYLMTGWQMSDLISTRDRVRVAVFGCLATNESVFVALFFDKWGESPI